MSLPALDNLIRIGQLKPEPRNELEVKRMLEMARWPEWMPGHRHTL